MWYNISKLILSFPYRATLILPISIKNALYHVKLVTILITLNVCYVVYYCLSTNDELAIFPFKKSCLLILF